jgi:Domain of unknown function (DUF397)
MAPSAELSRAAWRTSSYSNNGGECVELAAVGSLVRVRDTKHRVGAVLMFAPAAWEQFTVSLKG